MIFYCALSIGRVFSATIKTCPNVHQVHNVVLTIEMSINMQNNEQTEYKTVRGLTRGLMLLNMLNKLDGGASVGLLAELSCLHRTTVRRLLETLQEEGYVRRSPSDDSFRLTIKVRQLSEGFRDEQWISALAAALVGTGSSVFHPESSRVARMASGGRHGLAQSIFQVGGNFGSSLGPLLAAVIIAPYGKGNVAWFVLAALLAIVVLAQISRWYSAQHRMNKGKPKATIINPLPRNKVVLAVSILLILIFSKYFYMASISSYYTFYLMQKFGLSIQNAQLHLFAFLFAVAAGTVIGGPVGDKIGRKYVIWGSILGVAPFTLILPYASLHWTGVLTVIIGFILASAFSAILVYAQELLPGRIGMVSGLFFGFAFGMGGLGAAVLGLIADHTSIELVYKICAFLPLLGMLTIFLPDNRHKD